MEYIKQHISEVFLCKSKVYGDERGYFVETFHREGFEQAIGYKVNFCQDNESKSTKGVLRGLHFQLPPAAQSKLVRVIEGKVLDVAVDIRKGSPTFGQYVTAELSAENKHQLFVPRGFAHGFVVLSDTAIFSYKVDNYYSPENDRGLAFDDPSLNIDWQLPKEFLKLSEKDQKQPALEMLDIECSMFDYQKNLYRG
ncbi:dTDP-4-dehydrorhamnose 3,5-epimerase [Thiosulfatimonas sediminis]|uniref:dTDP-4-dehydrorhamnose 3,5-epimerase n=1 Tax=Thiosulfatimonas sediminis TaxID=2675054 RepID=A0A6F8PVJ8_9GAMM|nr:dTDP-4-dehydrorhamnose 3,5-epimerase [Thiosulfatimonas sediminis]BBP46163.1 dTDP-4-dehydrorhamnose 3,5-epimerase [Thiosulfatimonas sediminis]